MATPERLARLRQITATGAQPEPDQEHDRLERLRQLTGQQAEPPRRSPFARHEGTLRERVGAGLREAADVALQFTGRAGQGVTAAASGVAKLASTRLGRAMLPTPEGVPERVAESLDERYRTIGEVIGEPQSVGGVVSGVGGRGGVEVGLFMLPGTQAQKLAAVRQLPRFRRLATTLGLDALVDAAIGAGSEEGSTAAAAAEFFPEYEWLQQVAADPAKRAAFEATTGLTLTAAVSGIARGAVEIAEQVRRARAALDLTPDIERATQQAFSEYGRAQARAQRQRFPRMQPPPPPPPPPRQPEPGTAADVALRRAQALAEQRRIDEGLARQAEEEAARRRAMELEGAEPSDPRLVRGAAPPREPGLIEPPPRGEEPLIVPGTALRPREPLIRPPEPGELASVAETGMTTRRPRTPDVAAELAASLRRPGRARISDAAEAAEEAAAEAATATATARPMTIEEAQSRYGRALLQQLIEDAEIAGAGSPVRRKIANEDPNLAIGGVGTGAGAFARGRRTQAARRAREAEQVLESWGGVAPDPDLAILRAIDDDPLAVPHQIAVEHSALRNLDDDAVLRRLDEAEELAYRNQDSPSAMVRRAMLAGEAKRRGLIEAQPGGFRSVARGMSRAEPGGWQQAERDRIAAGTKRVGDTAGERAPSPQVPTEPTTVDDFTASMAPPSRARAKSALATPMRHGGTVRTRREIVEAMVGDGATVVAHPKDGRRLMRPDGSYIEERRLTKTAMDYAEYLLTGRRSGAADPRVMGAVARTGAGAVAGAALDEEDPVRGALAGGSLALGGPPLIRGAVRGRARPGFARIGRGGEAAEEAAAEAATAMRRRTPDLSQTRVVDAEGRPLRVYHGSTSTIEGDMRPGTAAHSEGIFFTDNPDIASTVYARGEGAPNEDGIRAALRALPEQRVLQIADDLRARNHWFTEFDPHEWDDDAADALTNYAIDRFDRMEGAGQAVDALAEAIGVPARVPETGANVTAAYLDMRNPLEIDAGGDAFDAAQQARWIRQAKEQGHDGLIIRNYHDGGTPDDMVPGGFRSAGAHTVYIAFDPKQVLPGYGHVQPRAPEAQAVAPREAVKRFAREIQERHGLQRLSLYLTSRGDLHLDMIEVPRAARKRGVGTAAMEDIVRFADENGLRVTLTPGLADDVHGTTSRGRLVRFYKRFGFVENKGRNKDFSIRDGMYREPRPLGPGRRSGAADSRLVSAVARTGVGAAAGAALDDENRLRGAASGAVTAFGAPMLIRGAARGRAQRGAFQHFPITERGQQVRARIRRGGDVHRPGMRYPRGEPEGVDEAIAARRAEREAAEEASRDRIIERATERTEASQAELRERWARDPWGMRADEEQFIREQQRQRERRFMEARFGGVDPKVLSVLARTGTGAAAGAAVDDENRVRGAVIGAAIANAPSVVRSARRGRRSANVPAYLDNPDVQAVLGTVSSRRQPSLLERVRALPERTRRASRDAYRRLVDETQPLRDFGRIVGKSPRLSHLVSQAKGWRGGAQVRIGTEFRDVMQLAKGHEKGVVALAKAERALELARAGMAEKGVDLQAAERTVRELSRVPEVRRAVDALRGYYRRLLEFKLDNGVLTPEQFERITANGEHYVPFVRDFGVDPLPPSAGGGRFTNRGTGVRRMTEGRASAPTVDPFEQAVLDTFEAHRTVAKQRVTNAVAELVEADPDAASEFLRRLDGDEKARTGREVAAMVNGQRQRYEVLDEQLYEAWAAFDRRTMNLLVRVMAPFKRALQAGVTLMPDFAARNTMRDNVQSAIQYRAPVRSMAAGAATGAAAGALSDEENRIERALIGAGLGLGIGGVGPQLVRSAAAMSDILGNRDVYREWLREGGSGFSEFYGRPEDARRLVRQLMGDRSLRRTILLPVDGARSLGRILEEAPRLARYKAMRKAGADIPEAIAASRDVSLDFANIGADTKPAAAVTAFFNAKVQGWDKLVRMLRQPRTWALGASMITAPSIALWAINKDDPEYWARPQWERNLFWLVPNPDGGFFRIPKPFEVGFLFASLPERILDYAYQKDPEVLTFALKDMLTSTTEGTVPIPTALQPLLENVVNYDFFTNRPVVSPGLERLDPAFQHDNRTSSVAVLLGRQLDISPQKIDNVLRDWSGNFGRDALRAADALARATGVDERPAHPARGAPILSSFVTQEGASSDFEHTIRRRFERAERARNTARDLAKRGDEEQLRRYIQKNAEQLLAYEALKAQNDMLRKVSEMRREIANAQGVDAETKREAIARLNRGVATLLMQIGRGEVLAQPAN